MKMPSLPKRVDNQSNFGEKTNMNTMRQSYCDLKFDCMVLILE